MAQNSYEQNEMNTDLPFSLVAEQTILGAVLTEPSVLSVVLEKIKPDCFFNDQHKALFQIIVSMFTSGEKADVITVLNASMQQRLFDTPQEGRAYLAALINMVPSVSNIESYCNIVAEKYYLRSLAFAARSILQDVQSGETDAQALLDSAEQRIFDIRQGRSVQGLVKIGDAVCEAYDRIGKISGPDKEK